MCRMNSDEKSVKRMYIYTRTHGCENIKTLSRFNNEQMQVKGEHVIIRNKIYTLKINASRLSFLRANTSTTCSALMVLLRSECASRLNLTDVQLSWSISDTFLGVALSWMTAPLLPWRQALPGARAYKLPYSGTDLHSSWPAFLK